MARSVEVNGITVSITPDKGGLIVYGKEGDLGINATIYGSGSVASERVHASFVRYNGMVVAIFPQVKGGNYWGNNGIGDVTIVPDYVSQATKRY